MPINIKHVGLGTILAAPQSVAVDTPVEVIKIKKIKHRLSQEKIDNIKQYSVEDHRIAMLATDLI